MSVGLCYEVKPAITTLDCLFREPSAMQAATSEYESKRSGALSHSPVEAIAFLPSKTLEMLPSGTPSLQQLIDEYLPSRGVVDEANNHRVPKSIPSSTIQDTIIRRILQSSTSATAAVSPISLGVYNSLSPANFLTQLLMLSHPLSRGSVHIASSSPYQAPIIDPAYLSHPLDRALYALHLMYLEIIATTPPLSDMLKSGPASKRLPAGHDAMTYENALKTIDTHAGTFYHPCGTCAMMSRELGGVVGERLVVYGTSNVRVCDASVLPMVPRGNIVSSVFAWAERGADLIREDWRRGKNADIK